MDLFDILACPVCKVGVTHGDHELICPQCQQHYPIVHGVPILLPNAAIPQTLYQHELDVRPHYDPWIHRIVLQSLPQSALVLDLGAGNMALNLPNVVRMDVTLTPYVDVVGDAHALPFLSNTFDFIFSLAVIEHLRQPFHAADQMYQTLRDGGYVYGECNFVFAYHGYPHHYFNASQQGLEQVFERFTLLRSGVAPYQMPSFALRMFVQTYLQNFDGPNSPEILAFRRALQNIVDQPLGAYDGYLTEEQALRTAAGVYFFGYKAGKAMSVIPSVIQAAWNASPVLQLQIPQLYDLSRVPNIMQWAKTTGHLEENGIREYFANVQPFHKSSTVTEDMATFASWPVIDPHYGNISDSTRDELFVTKAERLQQTIGQLENIIAQKNAHILSLETLLRRIEAGRLMRLLRRFVG